jgi:predicted nucleic acid-binding Zn ribbon protein
MVAKEKHLHRPNAKVEAHRLDNVVGLGEVVSELVQNRILPQQIRFGLIIAAWHQMLPAELYRHCRIVEISNNRIQVRVDSPSYMYEMQLCRAELLKELARRCPQARIKDIKVVVGGSVKELL